MHLVCINLTMYCQAITTLNLNILPAMNCHLHLRVPFQRIAILPEPMVRGTTNTFTVNPGEFNMDVDAGFYICSKIGNIVFYDVNKMTNGNLQKMASTVSG